MSDFKVGDEILIDCKAERFTDFFEGVILRIVRMDEYIVYVNTNEFKHPNNKGNWTEGWASRENIRKVTKLDRALK